MPYVTPAELLEIVPDLLAAAESETAPEVRAAMLRLAHRYTAMAAECPALGRESGIRDLAA